MTLNDYASLWPLLDFSLSETLKDKTFKFYFLILRLHYVPGGHGGHVSDNREQNGITVRQRRGTG